MTNAPLVTRTSGLVQGWRAGVCWLLAAIALLSVARPARTATLDEMRVHAAYVLNFVRYSRWPQATDRPVVISVLGTAADANEMRDLAMQAGSINGRRVHVRLVPLASVPPGNLQAIRTVERSAAATDVIYVGSSHRAWSRAVAVAMNGRPVLTVGPGEDFVSSGGMFGMYLDAGRVRFTVNAPAIRASSVDVSARLLSVARPAPGQ